jgi:RHS repeat-associated protein
MSECAAMRTMYKYDANGKRTNAVVAAAVSAAQYDAQDRLLSYDSATYQYNEAGTLTNKTIGGQATTYRYDALGSLLSVSSATAAVGYSVDALGRRIAKRVNGVMTRGYVYKDFLNPVAEVDNDDNVVSVFIYGTRRHVPDYLVKNGVTYRIIIDHLGSVRLVVNNNNGSIAQRIDYDEWGRVVLDTNPGFQPFGFAGGLYDPDTGLVRFGFRDYDAETGRWLAKDPILFAGGQANLYLYCHGDPINWVDAWGLAENRRRPGEWQWTWWDLLPPVAYVHLFYNIGYAIGSPLSQLFFSSTDLFESGQVRRSYYDQLADPNSNGPNRLDPLVPSLETLRGITADLASMPGMGLGGPLPTPPTTGADLVVEIISEAANTVLDAANNPTGANNVSE